ncbi:YuiB family protein [Paenibacillus assamensis]|uniref:YuiB family protein n=1 Tax=Paenibacillus assamensis TaxID=311244 RepID=UPI001B7FD253
MYIVLMVLLFVMMFGIGFILNMLMKTTWFPMALYVVLVIPLAMWAMWDSSLTFVGNVTNYGFVDILIAIAGLVGAYISGKTIGYLRAGGYKMF